MRRITGVLAAGAAVVAAIAFVVVTTCSQDETPRTTDARPAASSLARREPSRRAGAVRLGTVAPAPEPAAAGGDAPAATVTVRVTVRAEDDGAALAGATVVVIDPDLETDERSATTDATGAASFAGRAPGMFAVRAAAEGRVRSVWREHEAAAGVGADVEVRLARGVFLDGVVLDAASGNALAGAEVVVEAGGCIDGVASSTSEAPFGTATTAADGRFRVRVNAAEMATPMISARGHVPLSRTVIVPAGDAPPAPFEFRLEPAGRVAGTVKDPDGALAEGATVYAIPADEEMLLENPDATVSGGGRTRTAAKATTDPQGRWEIDGLAFGGAYRVLARHASWAQSAPRDGVTTTPEAPAAIVDLALRRHGAIALRILDPEGRGVAAPVVVSDGRWPQMLVADEAGTLRLERRHPVRHTLDVTARGFVAQHLVIDVEEGRTAERMVTLDRGLSVAGRVVDDRGEGVPGATVHVRRPYGEEAHALAPSEGETTSGADGAFVVGGLLPGAHEIGAYGAAGHAMTEDAPVEAPAKDLRVVMLRLAKVRFRVAVPEGADPPAEVYLSAGHLAPFSTAESEYWGGSNVTEPFGEGAFSLPFPPGASRLRVLAAGFAPVFRRFDLKPSEDLDLGTIRLDRGLTLTGRVLDASGVPVAGARVLCGESMTPERQTLASGADGSFRLDHLAEGKAEVTVDAAGFLTATIDVPVAAGGASTTIRLSRGVVLRVVAVDAEGKPVPAVEVSVRRPDAAPDTASDGFGTTDHRGRLEVRVPAGRWHVVAMERGGAADCEGAEGAATGVKLVVK